MATRKKSIAIESLLVSILMIIFASAIALIILRGSQTFEAMANAREDDENLRIAMSYIAMMTKQNDRQAAISTFDNPLDSSTALRIVHDADESGLATYIFSHQGALYEQYDNLDAPLSVELAVKIAPLTGIDFDYQAATHRLIVTYTTEKDQQLINYQQILALKAR